jgi:hypothetical protein
MAGLFRAKKAFEEGDVEFWHNPERGGWLMKQGNALVAQQEMLQEQWPLCSCCSVGKS